MKFYFQLQYKRLIRSLKDWGLNPVIGLILAVVGFTYISYQIFNRISYAQYVYPLLALISIFSLAQKTRNEFLKTVFSNNKYRKIRLIENLLLTVPFYLFMLTRHHYLQAVAMLIGAAGLSLYNDAGNWSVVIPTPFYKRPFEFLIGFRKNYLLLFLLYGVAVIAIVVNNYYLGMFCLTGTLLTCMGFYTVAEPVFYVWVHAQQAPGFLLAKIRTALIYSSCVCLPIALPFIFRYPSNAYIPLIVVFIGLLYVTMGVLGKYATYPHQGNLLQVLKLALGLIFPPALLILIPHFYRQSVQRLNAYLI
jgi:hypothetical protein